mmetsp:Transcript_19990/g.45286  ORF Transcript_19990/g.45286 Transcript_19990/m.45286 type:complete len:175 (+) Transcript_19990:1109-1633(+)
MVAAARNAIRAREEAIALLTNGLSLSKTDLVYVFESLKVVVLGLVVASAHYKVVFLQDPQTQFLTPIARVYFDKMDNGGVRALAAAVSRCVSLVTQGSVQVGSWTFDGAHRSLIDDSAQALAREAISDAEALLSNQAGLCDAPGAGTVGTNGGGASEEPLNLQSKLARQGRRLP